MRKPRYYWRAVNKKEDPIHTECLRVVMENPEEDEWARDNKEIEDAIKSNIPDLSLSQLRKKVINVAVETVQEAKQGLQSLQSQPQPREWFKLPEHVNDCRQSKIINMARSGNLQLGNRMRNKYGNQWKTCPICSTNSRYVKLNEPHVLLECPVTTIERKNCGIGEYEEKYQGISTKYIFRRYLGQDGCSRMKLLKRARNIHLIAEK